MKSINLTNESLSDLIGMSMLLVSPYIHYKNEIGMSTSSISNFHFK